MSKRPGCGKRRYRDRVAALLALATIRGRDRSTSPKLEARAYPCPACRGWHLTSQDRGARDRPDQARD